MAGGSTGGGGGGSAPAPASSSSKNKFKQETTPTFTNSAAKASAKGALSGYENAVSDLQRMIDNYEVVGFTPDQLMSHDMSRALALGAGGIFPTAIDEMMKTASGDYLYGGEGFNAAVDAAYRAAKPQILGTFGGFGRDQNFLGTESLGQTFVDRFALENQAERSRQMAAISALPGLALTPASILEGIGLQQQQQKQNEYDLPIAMAAQMPGMYAGITPLLQPFMGSKTKGSGSGTTANTYYTGNQGLGSAIFGAGLGGKLGAPIGKMIGGTLGSFGGPLGSLAGAGIGGALGGLFG